MSFQPKIILCADDDIDDQELLKEAFSSLEEKTEVVAVFTGQEVIDKLENSTDEKLPDLIVLDYNIPDMNGAQILEAICKNERYQDIPKVIWSTSNSPLYRKACEEAGSSHYFQKPQSFSEIIELAQKLLDLSTKP